MHDVTGHGRSPAFVLGFATFAFVSALATGGCFYPLDRAPDGIEPGMVAGRTVKGDDADAVKFSVISTLGSDRVVRSGSDGAFRVPDLVPGGYALTFADDTNGDGAYERTARRLVRMTLEPHAGLFGEGEPELVWIDLGDVKLSGAVPVSGSVSRGGAPLAGARVMAVRQTDLGDPAIPENDLAFFEGIEEQTVSAEDGTFRLEDVTEGKVKLLALSADIGGLHVSEAIDLDLDASSPPPPVAMTVPDVRSGFTEATIVLAGDFPDTVDVVATQPGSDNGLSFPGAEVSPGGRVVIPQLSQGLVYDIVVDAGDLQARLYRQLTASDEVSWGPALLVDTRECEPFVKIKGVPEDEVRDCDHDGKPGLPLLRRGPDDELLGDIGVWAACGSQCVDAFGSGEGTATCDVDGVEWDCDDDADFQPDVTEPPACYGPARTGDRDGDGLCDENDPRPLCPAPLLPEACPEEWTPPGVWPEYEEEPEPLPDAGVDAGEPEPPVDGGPEPEPSVDGGVDGGFDGGVDGGPVGVDREWDPPPGPGTFLFSDGENWTSPANDGLPPQPADDVYFTPNNTEGCVINVPVAVASITLDPDYDGTVNVDADVTLSDKLFDQSGTLAAAVGNVITVGGAGPDPTLVVSSGSALHTLIVGAGVTSATVHGAVESLVVSVEGGLFLDIAPLLPPTDHVSSLRFGAATDTTGGGTVTLAGSFAVDYVALGDDAAPITGATSIIRADLPVVVSVGVEVQNNPQPVDVTIDSSVTLQVAGSLFLPPGASAQGDLTIGAAGVDTDLQVGPGALDGSNVTITAGAQVYLSSDLDSPGADLDLQPGARFVTEGSDVVIGDLSVASGAVFDADLGGRLVARDLIIEAGGTVFGGDLIEVYLVEASGIAGNPATLHAPVSLVVHETFSFSDPSAFFHRQGDVALDPVDDSDTPGEVFVEVHEHQTFWTFTIDAPGGVATFASRDPDSVNTGVVIESTFTALGAPGSFLTLQKDPASGNSSWDIEPLGARVVNHLDVFDSANNSGINITPEFFNPFGNVFGWGPVCNNGYVEPGEQCDYGAMTTGSDVYCNEGCSMADIYPGTSQEFTWVGPDGGAWNQPNNWMNGDGDTGVPPFDPDTVAVFPAGSSNGCLITEDFVSSVVVEPGYTGRIEVRGGTTSFQTRVSGLWRVQDGIVEVPVGSRLIFEGEGQLNQSGGRIEVGGELELESGGRLGGEVVSTAPGSQLTIDGAEILAGNALNLTVGPNVSTDTLEVLQGAAGTRTVRIDGLGLEARVVKLSVNGALFTTGITLDGRLPNTRITGVESLDINNLVNGQANVGGNLVFEMVSPGGASMMSVVGTATYQVMFDADVHVLGDTELVAQEILGTGSFVFESGTVTFNGDFPATGEIGRIEMRGGVVEQGDAAVVVQQDFTMTGGTWNQGAGGLAALDGGVHFEGGTFNGFYAVQSLGGFTVGEAASFTAPALQLVFGDYLVDESAVFDHSCGFLYVYESTDEATPTVSLPGHALWGMYLASGDAGVMFGANETFTIENQLLADGSGGGFMMSTVPDEPFTIDARGLLDVADYALFQDAINIGPGWVGTAVTNDNTTRFEVQVSNCGDGIFDSNEEECDDGNLNGSDGCSAACTVEPGYDCPPLGGLCTQKMLSETCGDGVVNHPSEDCDTGGVPSPGCDVATCTFIDGYVCSGCPTVCLPQP